LGQGASGLVEEFRLSLGFHPFSHDRGVQHSGKIDNAPDDTRCPGILA